MERGLAFQQAVVNDPFAGEGRLEREVLMELGEPFAEVEPASDRAPSGIRIHPDPHVPRGHIANRFRLLYWVLAWPGLHLMNPAPKVRPRFASEAINTGGKR